MSNLTPPPSAGTDSARVLIGLHEERPCPGAVAYQTIAALTTASTYHNPRLEHGRGGTRRRVALALTEAASRHEADAAHLRLLELVAPLLGLGQVGLPLAIELMQGGMRHGGHQVLLWADGVHARLLLQGDHRVIHVRSDQATLIRPGNPDGIGHHALTLHAGDILVMVAQATQARLPLGTVAAMARHAPSMQALCQQATAQAAASDPLSHHAALALAIATT